MTAGDVCNRDVHVARPHELLVDAAQRMRERHLAALVVVAEPEGDRIPIGILSEQEAAHALDRTAHVPHLTVADVMSAEFVLVNATDDVQAVCALMAALGLCCVPVVNALGGLEGLLTRADVQRAAGHEDPVIV